MRTARSLPLLAVIGCTSPAAAEPVAAIPLPSNADKVAYWNQGKGELTSYRLEQGRYGELHEGHAVLIFVTEPFSREKSVKLDAPQRAGADAVEVLKLNHTRKFLTGLYPYSTMRSVFTPTNGNERALKVSATTQEWCGHVFMQLTGRGEGYDGHLFSYFESEGDRALSVPKGVWLEDDVWTTLRIDPNRLPKGEVKMLPSATYLRLRHVAVKPQSAQAELIRKDDDTLTYEVRYTSLDRTLEIDFEDRFPFRILGWRETQPSGWGMSKAKLTTVATKKAELMTDYWTKNGNTDRALRDALGLPK